MAEPSDTTSVLIAGGGPFGLMLAIELGRRGIATTIVDARPGTAINPQANATQARTMEIYRRLGIADEIRQLGLPPDYPTDIAYFTRYAHRELARFRRPASGEAAQLARNESDEFSAAELPHRVSQKFVEQILRRHADCVADLNYGWRLQHFIDHQDRIEAIVVDVATGKEKRIRADYLVGGDGARSMVRHALGIRLTGETGVTRDFFGGRMVAVYLRAPDFYTAVPHDRAWMYWAFNSERRSWLAAVNGVDEFAFHTQLKPGEDNEDVTPARARKLFRQVMGRDLDIELLSVDTWIAGHALVAERFRKGRVFIGGDAAHLFTPAGGLGYNTAVEDAVNLGWKLAATLKGAAGDALLDSYAFERHKLALRNTGFARELAQSIGNFVPHPALENNDETGLDERAKAGEYLNSHGRREFNIPGITFGGRYDGSAVIIADGAAVPQDRMDRYVASASPGGRLPHFWLEDGRSVFDLLGYDWTLLVMSNGDDRADAFARAAAGARMDLHVVPLELEEAKALYAAPFVLVRPDQIVAWRGDLADITPEEIIRRVLGYDTAASPAPAADELASSPPA